MAIPKYDELFDYVLRFLADGAEHSAAEMRGSIVAELNLTEEERNELLPSRRQRVIDNRIGWARTYLKKAGLMHSPKRGWYQIDPSGIEALNEGCAIDNDYLNRFESFREFKEESHAPINKEGTDGISGSVAAVQSETPDEALGQAYEEITAQLADEILDEVMKLSPISFERMVLDLMAKMGYGTLEAAAKTTPTTGDEGIDGVIMLDKLGFDLIYVQVKHYAADHPVGRPDIQRFVGAIAGRGGKGLFVTTSKFSPQAIQYARAQHIVLVDGQKLARLMIENDFGVATKQTFLIKTIDTDTFSSYTEDE